MKKKKMLLIINPKSGKNQIKPNLCDIIDLYVSNGYIVTVHTTRYARDARQIAKKMAKDYDIIVCAGGDGTLDEVCSGLLDSESNTVLGYIPAGTTNDFAKSLGITSKVMNAAQTVLTGTPFACDLGEFNGTPFIYVAAFGAFTQVSYSTPQSMKNMMGHTAYVIEGIKSLGNIKPYHAVCEFGGHVVENDFIYGMVTNSVSVGGFKSVSGVEAKLDDGLFEVLLIKMPKNLIEIQMIATALLTQKVDEQLMFFGKADKITVTSDDEIAWTLDGEDGGAWRKVEIITRHKAVRIIRPTHALEEIYDENKDKGL